ncbi:histidine kinase [Parabacteroides sp. OttesenSCG-928-N08]|nr:histidine kinase [Parabacteroides sp. OttesenSCG-928-N08]
MRKKSDTPRQTQQSPKEGEKLHASPIRKYGWQLHAVGWSVVLFIPLLFSGRDSEHITLYGYLRFLTVFASIILLFYANYSYLVKRFLFKRQTTYYLLSNLILIIAIVFATHLIGDMIPGERKGGPPDIEFTDMDRLRFFLANCTGYAFIAGLSVAFKMTSSWYDVETQRKELEQSRSEAELQNLKSQLNPHFLFNTLNNIYSLIAISPEKAQETVHDLSRLLRYVMYESSQSLVSLEKDVDFVRNYVELMRIRLPEHVELKTSFNHIIPGTLVAPLLFISLIENAFKHGISNNKESFIHIDITQDESRVVCTITNSDYHKSAAQDKSGSGIGLTNLRKRLELLYPDNYRFQCYSKENIYYSHLAITINNPTA